MPEPGDIEELTDLFRRLGATDADGWARSQVEEGIPQLYRFLFLRQAWKAVVAEDDEDWISQQIEHSQRAPDAPFSGLGNALERIRGCGARDEDILDVVRAVQALSLFDFCCLLDDPRLEEEEVQDLEWGLFVVDDEDAPTHRRAHGMPMACVAPPIESTSTTPSSPARSDPVMHLARRW